MLVDRQPTNDCISSQHNTAFKFYFSIPNTCMLFVSHSNQNDTFLLSSVSAENNQNVGTSRIKLGVLLIILIL